MKTRIASLVLFATLVGFTTKTVTSVSAQEARQEQELEQRVNVECTAGTYGQGQVCGVTTEQRGKQKQEIILRDGSSVAPHQVVGTALDMQTLALVAGLFMLGGVSAFGLAKIK